MTKYLNWLGIAAAALLIASCFLPWIIIESRDITVTGVDATGTNFGKPGYFHILMALLFILFGFIKRIWSKRVNLLIVAMNFAWAVRNYFVLSQCEGGDCPQRQPGLYFIALTSLVMLAAALFPDIKLPEQKDIRTNGKAS